MRYILILILLCSIVLTANAKEIIPELTQVEKDWIAAGHTVRVRVANWPPYQIHDGKNLTGISVDYIKTIFKRYGIKYKLISSDTLPWKEAIEDIAFHKRVDLLLTAKATEERVKKMLFTFNYVTPPWVIYTRDNVHDISKMEDLDGKTVAVQEGFVIIDWLQKNYPGIKLRIIRGVNTTAKAMREVATSNADAYIGNLATGSYFVYKLNFHNLKVVAVTPLGDDQNAMAVRNDWPELVSIINKSLLSFSEKYKLDVMGNYYSVKYDYGLNYTDILLWILITVCVCSLVIGYIVIVNKQLSKEIAQREDAEYGIKEYISLIDENVITITVNSFGIITSVSKAYCRISKNEKEDILGKNFLATWSKGMSKVIYHEVLECIASNREWAGEIEKVASDGSTYWIKATVSPKFDRNGVCLGYISVGHDITDRKLVERLSVTDRVTDSFNRWKLDEIFTYELAQSQRYNHVFSVILLDLDDFKSINDNFGHQTGDLVLKKIASILIKNTRIVDTVGRWGGDEFLLICPETTAHSAMILSENIRVAIAESKFTKVGSITVSIGVASYYDGDTQESLLERADQALYRAKESGKNKVTF